MGWLWPFSSGQQKSNQDNASQHALNSGIALSEEQRMRPASTSTKPTREEQADSELDEFMKSFSASDTGSAAPQVIDPDTPPEKRQTPEPARKIPDRILPDGSLDISPEAIYPRTMSCRQQFDQAFYCQSLGGKFNDIYRYGHLKSCSEQWGAFWFCMRVRTLPDHEKEEQIRDFYAKRDERRRKEFGSSEDVWEIRRTAVTSAFGKDPYKEEGSGVQVTE